MKINIDNYEAFFLDYFEGNLSPEEIDEMLAFIEQHPEIKGAFEGFENISLSPDPAIRFSSKDTLKKNTSSPSGSVSIENIEEVLIAEIEGLLSPEEQQQLERFLHDHPQYNRDRALFALTRLEQDASVSFENKDSLQHKAITIGQISESNYEDYLIREVEGLLNTEEKENLEQFFTENPQLNRDRKLYAMTRLSADETIQFSNKSGLRHSVVPVRRIVYYTLAAAASLTLLFSIYNTLDIETGTKDKNLAPAVASSVPQKPAESQVQATHAELAQVVTPEIKTSGSKPIIRKSAPSTTETPEAAVQRNTDPMPAMAPVAYNEIQSRSFVEPEFMFIRTSQMHSNEYLELYYNVKLAEQIQYAAINAGDENPEKTLFRSAKAYVSNLLAFNKKPEVKPDNELTVWTFAELGVKTYNRIAPNDVKLDLMRDETGKVVAYNLTGNKVDVQRDLKK